MASQLPWCPEICGKLENRPALPNGNRAILPVPAYKVVTYTYNYIQHTLIQFTINTLIPLTVGIIMEGNVRAAGLDVVAI